MFFGNADALIPREELHNKPMGFQRTCDIGRKQWNPFNHGVFADAFVAGCKRAGHVIFGEQWMLNFADTTLYGSIDIVPNPALALELNMGQKGWYSIGVVHSNETDVRMGLYVGATVAVCSNSVLADWIPLNRQVIRGKNINKEIDKSFHQWAIAAHEVSGLAYRMRSRRLNNEEAAWYTLEAANKNIVSVTQAIAIWRYWLVPRHKEFAEPTLWSLYNCFTETMKSQSYGVQAKCLHQLRNHLFKQVPRTTYDLNNAQFKPVDAYLPSSLHGVHHYDAVEASTSHDDLDRSRSEVAEFQRAMATGTAFDTVERLAESTSGDGEVFDADSLWKY